MRKRMKFGKYAGLFLVVTLIFVTGSAMAGEDISTFPNCPHCGMDRNKFSHSRMLIKYDDESVVGVCSLHCAAVDLTLKLDKSAVEILVGDYNSRELIDAEKAIWVLGGGKMGVMTHRAKWAFSDPEAADKFIGENGGEKVEFERALGAAYEDMHKDIKRIRENRKMKRMKNEHNHQ